MNIVVSAASLRMGGAVTIYNQFVTHLQEEIGKNHYFIFVNKVLQRPSISGVRYYEIDIESRKRRNWFDNTGCKEILGKEGFVPDVVVSLQNTGVKSYVNSSQLVYYHQPLPFFKQKWNPFKKDELSKFLYKHFYLWFVKRSIGPKTKFVVQTKFIKDNLVKRLGIDESSVSICFPDVNIPNAEQIKPFPFPEDQCNLIFPALYSPHKSHKVLMDAMSILKNNGSIKNLNLYFTFSKNDAPAMDDYIIKNDLSEHVHLIGRLSYQTTLTLYKGADAMLFPSTMETLGLPLIEAATFGLPILVADVPYAREVLEGYDGASFVKAERAEDWATSILELKGQTHRFFEKYCPKAKAGWHEFFGMIK